MSTGDDDLRSNQQPDNSVEDQDGADDLPAYVLDILDEDERAAVSSAISQSAHLRGELRRDETVVGLLAHALPRQQPPAELRERVLRSARQSDAEPVSFVTSRRERVLRWAAAAAAVLVAGLIVLSIVLWNQAEDRDDRVAALNTTMTARESEVAELQRTITAQEQQIADQEQHIAELEEPEPDIQINFTEPMVWSQLTATSENEDASGFFCRTQDGTVGWIIVENMPVDPDQVLQAWLIDEGNPIPNATFATDEQGRGFVVVTSEDNLTSYEQVGITVEPPGGSEQPSLPPVMTGELH